jgi:hypothetical protein
LALGVIVAASACGRVDTTAEPVSARDSAAQPAAAAPLVARVESLAGTAQSVDEIAERAGSYVTGLSNGDKRLLGNALVADARPEYQTFGASILVTVGEEQAAAPVFARFVLNGGDMTGFFFSWTHAEDPRTAIRMYIAIAEVLLLQLPTLMPAERDRAQAFLTTDSVGPPISTFSEQAVRDRIDALRRDAQQPARPQ